MKQIVEATKDNLGALYWDAALCIYSHGDENPDGRYYLVEDFDELEVRKAMSLGVKFVAAAGEPELFIDAPFQLSLFW